MTNLAIGSRRRRRRLPSIRAALQINQSSRPVVVGGSGSPFQFSLCSVVDGPLAVRSRIVLLLFWPSIVVRCMPEESRTSLNSRKGVPFFLQRLSSTALERIQVGSGRVIRNPSLSTPGTVPFPSRRRLLLCFCSVPVVSE